MTLYEYIDLGLKISMVWYLWAMGVQFRIFRIEFIEYLKNEDENERL